jgi:hypothetical protein
MEVQQRRSKKVQEIDPTVASSAPLEQEDDRGHGTRGSRRSDSWIRFISDRIWPSLFFIAGLFGLHEGNFLQILLYSKQVNRSWIHGGVFFSTLCVLFGSYIEVYRNMILGEKVHYETAKTSTHGMLMSIVLAGFCFLFGLWPVYGWMTLAYLFMWFWGVLVQFVIIFPAQIQRLLFGGAYLWFMHSYLSPLLF